jgi:hypothetical protein
VLVPTPHWVEPVASYFETTFGEHWSMTVRDGSNRSQHQAAVGSDDVATSLSNGRCVVGIAADRKILPQALTIGADLTIRLKAPRGDVVSDAIRRFTARRPMGRIEDNIVMGLDITDLIAAFRKGCSAKSIVTRLKAASIALKGGGVEPEHLPLLETAVEYGRARTWGLNLARDIAEYRAGRLPWSAIDRGAVLPFRTWNGQVSLFPDSGAGMRPAFGRIVRRGLVSLRPHACAYRKPKRWRSGDEVRPGWRVN